MNTVALITAFPPSSGSLNEYGYHLAGALAKRRDIDKLIIIADRMTGPVKELNLHPKITVQRVWKFNSPMASLHILRTLRHLKPDQALYNLQTASFGDREIPAALGLLAAPLSQAIGIPSGVIMHNLIDAVDLSQTNLSGQKWRQSLVSVAGNIITRILLKSGYVSVTLDSFWDILRDKYNAKNAFLVPHGSFPRADMALSRLHERSNTIITMGKFGTYKKLGRMIAAVQTVNARRRSRSKIKLIIGGSDHPATPGYLKGLSEAYADDDNIVFHGYVAEDDVANFFTQAKLAIFDYDSTTGSSGVLHQAAIYGTAPLYPLMGDFVDVAEREGLLGFHYKPMDQAALQSAIEIALKDEVRAQNVADQNLVVSESVTMETVAAVQMQLLKRLSRGRFFHVRNSTKQALWLRPRSG